MVAILLPDRYSGCSGGSGGKWLLLSEASATAQKTVEYDG